MLASEVNNGNDVIVPGNQVSCHNKPCDGILDLDLQTVRRHQYEL